ncbi:Metallo-hydrolase/oxidoreductase [Didymella exigua CBS 183.55]|uniref:Metallo-hydrolase/oxidoreductase n=1 Tax=Didymella exigua CBS 183.55 TaxID=1150837 RepID=A0A6A5RC23_9PLEO|nr:Metallo-hydrolase/oxidoreductase [Didymella exigua CBS 183.55]KAF1924830.1 Metallo-hydrolase/oxidoreductase [Didymella exigua CBS 183.55]
MSSQMHIRIPQESTAVKGYLINPVNFGPAQIRQFMAPPVPGLETFKIFPSHSFYIEHPSGKRLVFDLGIRKDYPNYSKSIVDYLPTTKYDIQVSKIVVEILEDHGVSPETIEAIVWSPWHWDHIGDPSSFPYRVGYPANLISPIRESDYANRELREIRFETDLKIGQFPAFDYFGDGSFYLLDSPGHAIGHLCGLAGTTTDGKSFILLGGDICHHAGIFRPSQYLPVPKSISPHPCNSQGESPICQGTVFEELQKSRGRSSIDNLYDMTFGHDISLARNTETWLQELDVDERIFVIISHDSTVRDGVDHFPRSLND